MYLKSLSRIKSGHVEKLLLAVLPLALPVQGRSDLWALLGAPSCSSGPAGWELGVEHSPWIRSTQITHTLLLHLNEAISPLLLVFINKVWHYWLILGQT